MLEINESFSVSKQSYDRFANLQRDIAYSKNRKVQLYFNIEKRLGYTFVFLISTLPFLAKKNNKSLEIYFNKKSFLLLKKVGFICEESAYSREKDYAGDLLEKGRLITHEQNIFNIVTQITNEAPVEMSNQLADIFISKVGEMYNNAIEHSQGDVIGAKYFKNRKNVYCFSCYDNGCGIPQKIFSCRHDIKTQIDAFKWAMVNGHSTATDGQIPRGIGLGLLKNFVQENDGSIRVCSGKILYVYNTKNGEKYYELKNEFIGTLFEMDIISDNDRKYVLK